jgi:hypothetical protein
MAAKGRPSLEETFGRVLAGCVPLPCHTRTQSEIFRTRSEAYLSSISEKSRRQEERRAASPAKARMKIGIQPQVREWERNVPEVDKWEAFIAPMGRDREMARKSGWKPDANPVVGTFLNPRYRALPDHTTRAQLRRERSEEALSVATHKINKSYDDRQRAAENNERIARQAHLSTHVPLTHTQSELLARRRQQTVVEADALRTQAQEEMLHTRASVMTAPAVAKGWWQKGDVELDASAVLTKGSNVRLRRIAQRTVQPADAPFKQYNTSIVRMKRDRSHEQKRSVELAVVDRSGPEWTRGESHLPTRPAIPVKRWSDVVIEFAQADQKLEEQRMDGGDSGGGGGGGSGGRAGSTLSISDTRPLFSSFTKDGIFREPVYNASHKRKQLGDDQASCLLQPLGGCNMNGQGGARNLTLMQRSHRVGRFRVAYADKLRERKQMGEMQAAPLQNLSQSLGSGTLSSLRGRSSNRDGDSRGGLQSVGSFGGDILGAAEDERMSFRDRGATPTAGAGRRSLQSRGGASTVSAGLLREEEGSLGKSMSMEGLGGGGGSIRPHSRAGGTLAPSQSVPDLGAGGSKNSSRASTAPSSQEKRGRGGGGGARRRAGQQQGAAMRSFTRNTGGSRPSTAPLRMSKRPGTAVRTRGFFDD